MVESVDTPDLKSVEHYARGSSSLPAPIRRIKQLLNKQKQKDYSMKYRIDARYVWYNRGAEIVLMYFINQIPFTFDDLPKDSLFDLELIKLADNERRFEPEDLYQASYYLMLEECHPLLYELELENPEMLPAD